MNSNFESTLDYAKKLDSKDPLHFLKSRFVIPQQPNGKPYIYLCGNSLGLMPAHTPSRIHQELNDWGKLGVEGHIHASRPWVNYHEHLSPMMAKVVGANSSEVVVMNSLTVNLHLLMVSFYRPTSTRYKILIDYSPFPSDRYAIESQVRFHGYDPREAIIELIPEEGNEIVDDNTIANVISTEGDQIALVMMGGVNYYTGQVYDMQKITEWAHTKGCIVGFDLAHAAGNVPLELHAWNVDFAAWCTYKYLNSGPGSLSGIFIHSSHHHTQLPRFEGWWGHDKISRFKMDDNFIPIGTAESWQLSNPPILSMAAISAALELFDEVGMAALSHKSKALSAYFDYLFQIMDIKGLHMLTPRESQRRGCQISLQMKTPDKAYFDKLIDHGIIADWREPDVIRIAPVPSYNSFEDIWQCISILKAYQSTI